MKPLPLTIVTAVLNEEKILSDFLAYAKSMAEEVIVVVDYRSTDRSLEIARSAGVKVLEDRGDSKGIVFNNKNWGMKEAKHEWILILDADERLDSVFENELKDIVENKEESQIQMYQTGFINYEFGKYFESCDQKYKRFIRLVRKGSFLYQTAETAEGFGTQTRGMGNSFLLKIPLLRTWALNANPKIKNLKGFIIHMSHPTIADFIRKINHYSTREAIILYQKNPRPLVFFLIVQLVTNPLREFVQKYVVWKMYKEGPHGVIASILYSFYHFLIMAKYLSLTCEKPAPIQESV